MGVTRYGHVYGRVTLRGLGEDVFGADGSAVGDGSGNGGGDGAVNDVVGIDANGNFQLSDGTTVDGSGNPEIGRAHV
jgi:hypothetical protein